jgi:hypothetical protein
VSWRIAGSYFEACNCEAVCPCRMISGIPGGRSTYGECFGVLSWAVEDGHAEDVDLTGLAAAMVVRYHDDEPGSPWSFVLHVDERASRDAHDAIAEILTGARGGPQVGRLPWVRKPSTLLAVRSSPIELTADGNAHRLRVGSSVDLAADEVVDPENVRCGIPGYDEPGVELYAGTHRVEDDPFAWTLEGRCAFASRFDYAGGAPG